MFILHQSPHFPKLGLLLTLSSAAGLMCYNAPTQFITKDLALPK